MEVKKVKHQMPWLTLLSAIGIIALGILILFLPKEFIQIALDFIVTGVLLVYGIVRSIQNFLLDKLMNGFLTLSISWTGACILTYISYNLDNISVIPSIVIGAVSLLLGIMRLMICINCIANRYKGKLRNGFSALICLVFGLFLVTHPIENFSILIIVVSVYLMIYGITMLVDFFAIVSRTDMDEERLKRRTHYALPNLINAVKPANTITSINKKLEEGKITNGVIIEEKEGAQFDEVNLEIMVHLTTQGTNKFGHVDIAMKDKIISYGTYDSSKDKFGGFVSQGTVIIVPKNPYLKYCLDYQKKYVIGFGAALSDKQYEAVQKRVDELLSYCEPFESNYEKAIAEGKDGSEFTDSASNIVRDVGGKVYTVVTGPFRRYFGINTNCVHVADWLLSESGIDAISFSSLRTPGAYYAMLQNMFRRKNNRIVRKTTYILSKDIE